MPKDIFYYFLLHINIKKCKPILGDLRRVVGSCSNIDNKDFDSSLWQNGRTTEKTDHACRG